MGQTVAPQAVPILLDCLEDLPFPMSSRNTDSPLAASRQLILVTASGWQSTTAELRRFARESPAAEWRLIGGRMQVSLGQSGLAWGSGLHPMAGIKGRLKQEGDGCAPAGIFAITALFGDADPESPLARSARLPYHHATRDLKCIDDPASVYYNQIVDQAKLKKPDWQSHEEMLRDDERYAVGAVIAHNSPRPLPGAGSCIFLHVWQAAGLPTAGCTAGALADIGEICRWLDGAAAPLLVQLPQPEYLRLKERWALPAWAT